MRKRLFILHSSFFILMLLAASSSCTESFSDRCRREAREYTERQCPRPLGEYIVMDSMTYQETPQGFTYHQTVQGLLDNDSLIADPGISEFRDELCERIRQDISLKPYKDRDFTFRYRYTSASTGQLFTEVIIGPEDYGK